MILDCKVSTIHFHITDLPFTSIPKCPIRHKIIFISVSHASITGENKNIWLILGRADSSLSLTTKRLLNFFDSVIDLAWFKWNHDIIFMKLCNVFINDLKPTKTPPS